LFDRRFAEETSMTMSPPAQPPPLPMTDLKTSSDPPRVRSDELLGPTGALVIEHAGRRYLLRVTQNGKLILTA
jgi:hemin uptake protein HemP